MARYTRAYCSFTDDLKNIENFLKLTAHRSIDFRNPNIANVNNLVYRASIVLLSSAMEGYVKELAGIVLERVSKRRATKRKLKLPDDFRYYLSADIIWGIRQSQDPKKMTKKIVSLFQRDSGIWSGEETFPAKLYDTHHEYFVQNVVRGITNPRVENLQRFMKRIGYQNYQTDMRRSLKAHYLLYENMVNSVIDRRNKIAHGDMRDTVTSADVTDMLRLTRLFFRETDVLVANWYRDTVGCAIR